MAEIDLTPTEEMAANAARGLELRRKHGKGGTEIGVARARDISNRKNLSPETVRRMHAFFSRHEKNKAGGEDDAGYIAWLLWGGDSGQSWAKRKVEQMDKGENQRSDTYKEIAQRLGSAAKMAVEAGWRVSPDAKSSGLTVAELLPKLAKGHTFYANLKSGGTVSGTLKAFSTSGVKIDKYGDVTDLRWSDIASVGAGNIGTGPYPIRASRPGAKAKMAANEVDLWNYLSKSDVVLARQNATDLATLKRYAQMALTKPDFTPPSRAQHGPSLHAMAKDTLADIRAWEESVQRHRNRMSRPGTKAKMGANEDRKRAAGYKWQVRYTKQLGKTDYLGGSPQVIEDTVYFATESNARDWANTMLGKGWFKGMGGSPEKVLTAKVLMFSRPGTKVANAVREGEKVSASDDAVSRKIRKLMDEGKPQKQAVAIALDLERRGEL